GAPAGISERRVAFFSSRDKHQALTCSAHSARLERKSNGRGLVSVLRHRGPKSEPPSRRRQFEAFVLPQLDTLYRTALGLTHSREQAEDLVQETCLRAYRAFDRFDGQHCRAWLLTILRHTY